MKKLVTTLSTIAAVAAIAAPAFANTTPQTLPFAQDWSNIGLITVSDDWSAVPGIVGYRGDDITASTGTDPQTLTGDGTVTIDVNANVADPSPQISGGVYENELTDPVVSLQGSGTADAPNLVLYIDATGKQNITVSYQLRDVDASADIATQPVALQYRTAPGAWTNVPAGFVANGALPGANVTGPSALVVATLPAGADGSATLQIRIITSNAVGNDQHVGVDSIRVFGEDIPTPAASTTWGKLKSVYKN
jgi:uncharacterized protein